MSLHPEERELIDHEVEALKTVIDSLLDQQKRARTKLMVESERARELTSSIVATRREEDKALLASDEAVSHGLKDQKREELDTLHKQIEKPYFARIVLEEEESKGPKIIEYKLGFSANPDCRIVDWRKAPISKLYYEYKEGDDYSEEILGRERVGRITLRNRVEIEKSVLKSVSNRLGQFVKENEEWRPLERTTPGPKSSASHLPEILSLITPSQFRTITEDADSAILIQGIAGSGKTTVALHRLAWLLHEENSSLEPQEAVILVLSASLKAYIINSLPHVGISGIKVLTYREWAHETLAWVRGSQSAEIRRPETPCPASIDRLKRSMALLKALEQHASKQPDKVFKAKFQDLKDDLLSVLSKPDEIISFDETRLIDREIIAAAHARTKENFADDLLDLADDSLLLRLYQIKIGNVLLPDRSLGKYGHIVVDEVQDFSPSELSTVIGAVRELMNLTLVGDVAQNISEVGTFPGWEKLRAHWNFHESMSKYVSLTVSHRSTLPIMKVADYIQNRSAVTEARMGRVPIWFKCKKEAQGIEAAIKWIGKASQLFPNAVSAVLCADPAEAKFAYNMLQPTFGPLVRLGDQHSFSFEEGIIVTDVKQVKGLEFYSVLLWNPSHKSYPKSEYGRNLLYVAVTRAEENLCLITWSKPSEALPSHRSPLFRGIDLTIEDEE